MSTFTTTAACVVISSISGFQVVEPDPVVLVRDRDVPAYVQEKSNTENRADLELALAAYKKLRLNLAFPYPLTQ